MRRRRYTNPDTRRAMLNRHAAAEQDLRERNARYAEKLKVREATAERCPTPRCIEIVEKHGPAYIRTEAPYLPSHEEHGADLVCTNCGGVRINGVWVHVCTGCGETVEAGGLSGQFVPNQCATCRTAKLEADRASGSICPGCHQPFSNCHC